MPTRTEKSSFTHTTGSAGIGSWLFAVACVMFMSGSHLDAWAHINVPELETFFTPWHALLYLGYLSTFIVLSVWTGIRFSEGTALRKAIPPGYGLSAVGMGVFLFGGLCDMLWHSVFGVETSIEMLVSPPHILIAAGAFLIVSGGYREWNMADTTTSRGIQHLFPMLISILSMTAIPSIMTHSFHIAALFPFAGMKITLESIDQLYFGAVLSGACMTSLFLLGCLFLPLRKIRLPFGSVTLVIFMHMLAMTAMYERPVLLPASVIAALVADVFLLLLPPLYESRMSALLFSFFFPVGFFLILFGTMFMIDASLPLSFWLGTCVVAGCAGLLFGHMAWPVTVKRS